MKKILVSLLLFSLCLSPIARAASFYDVEEAHENYLAVEALKEREIVAGYEDGSFGVDSSLNRAEAMKILALGFGLMEAEDVTEVETEDVTEVEDVAVFSDVPEDAWFYEFVMKAYEQGIVAGYEDGSFGPAKEVTLAEALKMAILTAGFEVDEEVANEIFADVLTSDWYAIYADFSKEKDLLLADLEGKIYPNEAISRGAFAEIVYRLMKIKEEGWSRYRMREGWTKYESEDLPLNVYYDEDRFELVEGVRHFEFWVRDDSQVGTLRLYPESVRIVGELDRNDQGLNVDEYFARLKAVFAEDKLTEFSFEGMNSLEIADEGGAFTDWYIYLESGFVLTVYTEYGGGLVRYFAPALIREMLSALEYREMEIVFVEDYSALLSEIFKAVLVENMGMEMLDKLPSKIIIETDAVGVGTGPVDYYYCEEVDYTFKYERAADVVLDKREGSTSAF
ncbi:S-layer homology domain-containing protein [Patescibacteria group bacterium]|nr:S-layer homology domain-containing protein [Patescibacteria group bacterium]